MNTAEWMTANKIDKWILNNEQSTDEDELTPPHNTEHLKNLSGWENGLRVVWFTFGDIDDWRCEKMTRQQFDLGSKLGGWSTCRVGE